MGFAKLLKDEAGNSTRTRDVQLGKLRRVANPLVGSCAIANRAQVYNLPHKPTQPFAYAFASAASLPATRPNTITRGRPCSAKPPADSPHAYKP